MIESPSIILEIRSISYVVKDVDNVNGIYFLFHKKKMLSTGAKVGIMISIVVVLAETERNQASVAYNDGGLITLENSRGGLYREICIYSI